MARQLKFNSADIQDMSDGDLSRLAYNCQVAFATYIATATNRGAIKIAAGGGGENAIGSAVNTAKTQQVASQERDGDGSPGEDWPAYPGLGDASDVNYSYVQMSGTSASHPSNTVIDNNGTIYSNPQSNPDPGGTLNWTRTMISPHTTFPTISELAAVVTSQMKSNRVGVFHIGTTTPTDGGAGTWTDLGTWFTDTTYSAGTVTYKLYLKRALDTPPGSDIAPLGYVNAAGATEATWGKSDNSAVIQERVYGPTSDLVVNVLMPYLINRDAGTGSGGTSHGSSYMPYYTVNETSAGYTGATTIQTGTFKDTAQTTASQSQQFTAPNYVRTSTPSVQADIKIYQLLATWA
jgi:hypothetical protein